MQHDKNRDELSREERAKFAALPRERAPASALEERIVGALKAKGLIRVAQSFQVWTLPRLAGAFAAAAVLLALGFGAGKWQSDSKHVDSHRSLFVLFLYGGEAEGDEASKVVEYGRWARTIRESKRMITGEKLKEGGQLLRKVEGQLQIREAKSLDGQNMLGGYFLIEAESYDDALKVAASCPHLKYGGLIELRQIDQI
jgi:hypothetical protein